MVFKKARCKCKCGRYVSEHSNAEARECYLKILKESGETLVI